MDLLDQPPFLRHRLYYTALLRAAQACLARADFIAIEQYGLGWMLSSHGISGISAARSDLGMSSLTFLFLMLCRIAWLGEMFEFR